MPQFLIPPGKREGDLIRLDSEESHHVRDVFRKKRGDKIRLFDGEGGRFFAEIKSLNKREVSILLLRKLASEMPKGTLKIAQALLRREKMELVIQKAVELGVSSLHPFTSSRTIVKQEKGQKLGRWQKIADEAAKQCGRGSQMKVDLAVPFDDLLKNLNANMKLIFWEEGGEPIRNFFRRGEMGLAPTIIALIGPEGGFSREEIESGKENGFVVLSLGKNILRAETAALAATTLIQYELGNL